MITIIAATFATTCLGSATLFGLDQEWQFGRLDPNSGGFQPIGNIVDGYIPTQELSSIDSKSGIYYQIGYRESDQRPTVIGLDVRTGKVVVNTPLPLVEGSYIGGGEQIDVDPATGHILVGGRSKRQGPHVVGSLEPRSGKFTKLAEIPSNYSAVLGGRSAFAHHQGKLLLQLGEIQSSQADYFIVDVRSGTVQRIPEGPRMGLSTMAYNPSDGLVYGLGLDESSQAGVEEFHRVLRALNVTSMKVTEVCSIKGFLDESGGESALDPLSNQLTWLTANPNGGPESPHVLITTDIRTCETRHAPYLQGAYPWSIEYQI